MMETTMAIGNTSTLAALNKGLGRKCFRLRRGYGGQVAFSKLDSSEIPRIKKSAYAKATAVKSALAAGARAWNVV